jgi:hypothetical protein
MTLEEPLFLLQIEDEARRVKVQRVGGLSLAFA